MSGGSFDYISVRAIEQVIDKPEEIHRMIHELRDLGYSDLADATLRWYVEARRQMSELEERLVILQDAWHGVEWWRSNDHSRDAADRACRRAADALRTYNAPLVREAARAEAKRDRP